MTNKQELLEKIYEEIGVNDYLYDNYMDNNEMYSCMLIFIGDVLSWITKANIKSPFNKKDSWYIDTIEISKCMYYLDLLNWDLLDKPIDEQTDECIEFVYSLIQEHNE